MDLWRYLEGRIYAELTSADLYCSILAIQNGNIAICDIESVSDITIRFCTRRSDWKKLCVLLNKRGDEIKVLQRKGYFWTLCGLKNRLVLVVGMLSLLLFSIWLPSRVLFIQVQGNERTDARLIAQTAAECGIYFGAYGRDVRSEQIKNALLEAMPELNWAGVNTYGCTAVITVRERAVVQTQEEESAVSSIIALRDGVVRQLTVLQGNAVCSVGQVVKQGQLLISGYTDCGICIQATNAKGEIFAETNRELCAVFPSECQQRGEKQRVVRKYSLIIGKKRINFSNNSGISGAGCAKIYEEKYLTLPGGFVLPVAIGIETYIMYDTQEAAWQCDLSSVSRQYLLDCMYAGTILLADEQFEEQEGLLVMRGSYSCYEMIGITKIEERLSDYVENN